MTAVATIARTLRPWPPAGMLSSFDEEFEPSMRDQTIANESPSLEYFVERTLLNPESKLYNPDHDHLGPARIGYLWTNAANSRKGVAVAGSAGIPKPPTQMDKWGKARFNHQLRQWFGTDKLDFLITIDANYAKMVSDLAFVALLDHELYHCAQKKDEWGSPKFNKETGLPIYGLLAHDVEEFVGIIRRYGAKAGAGKTVEFVKAARKKPEIAEIDISSICGSCL
jgi:hypothetical protein